jgi:hypothetical protein
MSALVKRRHCKVIGAQVFVLEARAVAVGSAVVVKPTLRGRNFRFSRAFFQSEFGTFGSEKERDLGAIAHLRKSENVEAAP